jgi:hypothetical protein
MCEELQRGAQTQITIYRNFQVLVVNFKFPSLASIFLPCKF